MRKINNRLIISDFDGTLTTSLNEVPDEVCKKINEYAECGGIFAVCTGRMLCSILPRVRGLGLKGIVAACQGTVIAEIESGKIIKNNLIGYAEIANVCRFVEELQKTSTAKYGIQTYSNDKLYTDLDADNERLLVYERITGVNAETVKIPMSDFILKNKIDCQKVTFLVNPKYREELYLKLIKSFGVRFDVTCSADVLVEVSPLNDNKGEALKFIANYYNVPLNSTVAVGDNLNDMSMIKIAQTGVAVGNAVQGLKDVADCVTVTNNECAVAKIVEKYGFI